MRMSSLRRATRVLCLAGACIAGAFAQPRTPAPSAKNTAAGPRNFDARTDSSSAVGVAQHLTRSTELVNRRRTEAQAFVNAETAARPGTRVTLSRHGVAKLFVRDGGALSDPMGGDPEDIARNFLRYHTAVFPFSPDEIDGLRITKRDVSDGVAHLTFQQTAGGVDVFEGQIKVTVAASGEVVGAAGGESTPGIAVSGSRKLNASEAGATATSYIKGPAASNVMAEAELNVFPLDTTSGRLAYRAFVEVPSGDIYEVVVDAENGSLLYLHNLAVNAGYGVVWTKYPSTADTRKRVDFKDSWLAAGATVTTGNNADVYLDRNYDLLPDTTIVATGISTGATPGRATSATQAFDFTFGDGTVNLDPRQYQAAAVTNAFYFINKAHDDFYDLGFTEAAGNFQNDNAGKGGTGGDYVKGLAQYGGFTNNASMSTPKEGISPNLKLGLFTRGTAGLTDDFDTDYSGMTIMHEYAHGVSNRLVGSGSTSCLYGAQSGSLGEGWSDYFAISFFDNPVVGAYESQNTVRGIRRQSYEGYSYKYEDIGNNSYEVHNDGEIWTATLWDIRKTLSQTIADKLVMNGLKSTPCNPSMTDARDAILAADVAANAGANRTNLWTVFARHGLGYSANGKDGDIDTGQRYDAAYDLPPDLQTRKNPAITSNPLAVVASSGSPYSYTVAASNPNNGTLSYALTSGPSGMTVNPQTGLVQWTGAFTTKRVKITVNVGQGGSVVHGYMVPAKTPLTPGVPTTIDGEEDSTGLAYFNVPSGTQILQVTLRGGSGDPDLYVVDPDGYYDLSGRDGSNETITYVNPKAGWWWAEVDGYTAYSGVQLTASFITPETLTSGTRAGLNGVVGSELLYKITVPANTAYLKVGTSGGTGDVDLFLRRGAPATCQLSDNVTTACAYTYLSANDGNSETLAVMSPAAGDWYLDLSGYDADGKPGYSDVTLTTAIGSTGAPVLNLGAALGTTYTDLQTVTIPNALGSGAAWTATAYATWQTSTSWLKISKDGSSTYTTLTGTGDATFFVIAKPPQSAGTYTGTITVSGTQSAPIVFNVNVVVTSTGTTLVRTGVLSHIVAGAEWQTSLSLLNTSSAAVTARVVFRTDDGNAWSMPLTVTVAGSTSQVTSSAVDATIPARSTLVISAGAGMSSWVWGSAEVLSTGTLSGYAIFHSTDPQSGKISEGTSPLQTDFQSTLSVPFDNLNGNQMGIALMNLGTSTSQVTVAAYKEDGTPMASAPSIQLAAMGHTALSLSSLADAFKNRRGYVVFQNPSGSLAGLGLRFISDGTFTSVPAMAATGSSTSVALTRAGALAQIAAGAEWQTSLSLLNPSDSPVTARVVFRTDAGQDWSMPMAVTLAGASSQVTSNQLESILPAHSTLVISLGPGMPQLAVGAAEVLSTGPISGYAIFHTDDGKGKISEGTSPLQTNLPASLIVPFDNKDNNSMGIAIENLGNAIAPLVATAWDESGNPLGSETTIQFAASGHKAFGLADQLPATAGKRGYVKFQNPLGTLSGLGLRFIPYGTFTSVPSILP
jgi:hypothetical protein